MKVKLVLALPSLLVTLLATSQASASWFQDNCSNGAGTVQVRSGHNDNDVILTERTWGPGPRGYEDKKVTLDPQAVKVTTLETKELYKKENKGCSPNSNIGYYSNKTVSYEHVSIANADGSAFPKETLGVSDDGKSVEAFLVCERDLTSMMPCR